MPTTADLWKNSWERKNDRKIYAICERKAVTTGKKNQISIPTFKHGMLSQSCENERLDNEPHSSVPIFQQRKKTKELLHKENNQEGEGLT